MRLLTIIINQTNGGKKCAFVPNIMVRTIHLQYYYCQVKLGREARDLT